MKKLLAAVLFFGAANAYAYNEVAGDADNQAQYNNCVAKYVGLYDGGNDASNVPGKSKVQAFCQCIWNEAPDEFKGDLVAWAEKQTGTAVYQGCEKYSGWKS